MKTIMKFVALPGPALLMGLLMALLTACGSQTVIVHDQDERSANEILTYLNDRDIPAVKEKAETSGGGGAGAVTKWNIIVDASHANEAMAVLNAVGLPRRRGESLLGIFTNTSLVPSEMQEQIRYQAGLAEQLSNIIRKFDGVIDADVQLSFPKEDLLNPAAVKIPASAAVYVKHNGVLDDPNSHLESKIRRLVANGVPNLGYDNVTVVGERTRYGDGGLESSESSANERPLVSIWSLIIAKESVTRFRVLFFSFFVAILVLLALIAWLIWKLFPVLKRANGIRDVLSLRPLEMPKDAKDAEAKGLATKTKMKDTKEPAGQKEAEPSSEENAPELENDDEEDEEDEESDEDSKGA